MKKTLNQQPCILKAVSLCVVTSWVHKHTLQALNPLPSSQGFGCPSSRSALIRWCLTSYQASLKSFVREKPQDVLSGASAPWLRSCIRAQALAIGPRLSCTIDMAMPGSFLCWSRDCFADLASWLGLRPASSLQTFLRNFITVALISEVIQQAVELVNPGLLWIPVHYDSFPLPLASSTQKTPGLPSLCLQDLACIKSLSSQPTLPPHRHHASASLTTQTVYDVTTLWVCRWQVTCADG